MIITWPSRRRPLVAGLGLGALGLVAAAVYGRRTPARALGPTPSCTDGVETPDSIEGPYFRPRSPERTSLRGPGLPGAPLTLTGQVLTMGCRPVAGTLLDFWHADAEGAYDLEGFRLRGHQFTDSAGRYRLETILPGLYPGRTRHIHVKVQAPHGRVLTTQLYFPGEARNARDGLFDPRLQLVMPERPDGTAHFDFVLIDIGEPA